MNVAISKPKTRKNSLLRKIKRVIMESNNMINNDEQLRIQASKIFLESMINK